MPALNSISNHSAESWCCVSAIAELAEIFDPTMQVCSWQRTLDANLTFYLSEAAESGTLQMMEVIKTGDRAKLADLPAGDGGELLRDDVAL